jgi:iron complex transport system substrate-binding protein
VSTSPRLPELLTAALLFFLFLPVSACAYSSIVSLSPQITESLFLLGAGNLLIGDTTFCKRPKEAAFKEKMGSPARPDIEKIISFKPDLVLASREGNSPWIVERLKRAGLNVVYFRRPKNLNELLNNFTELGRVVQKEGAAAQIVDDTRAKLSLPAHIPSYRVFWQVGAEPLMAASSNSFANDIIRLAGGVNVVQMEMPYPRINREEVVLKRPDLIVLADHGYNVKGEMERWRTYLRNARFVVIDPYVVGSPTPVTFVEAVEKVRRGLEE